MVNTVCVVCLQLRNSEGSLIIPKGSIEVNTASTLVNIAHSHCHEQFFVMVGYNYAAPWFVLSYP